MTSSLKISDHLNIEISEDNKSILKPSPSAFTKRAMLRDAKGEGAKLKLAARKLDALGHIKSHSSIANDPDCLRKLQNQLQLSELIAAIERDTKAEETLKKDEDLKERRALGPQAMKKLADKKLRTEKLTKKEICTILVVYCSEDINWNSMKKDALIRKLKEKMSAGDTCVLNASLGKDTSANVDRIPLPVSDAAYNVGSGKEFTDIDLFYSNATRCACLTLIAIAQFYYML